MVAVPRAVHAACGVCVVHDLPDMARHEGAVRTMQIIMPTRTAAFAIVLLLLTIPAFWPDYGSRLGAVDPYTHVHAGLGLLWLLALITQPLLIRARRVPLHRTFGRPAVMVGVAFVVSSALLTHHRAARMEATQFDEIGHGFALPLIMAMVGMLRSLPPLHPGRPAFRRFIALVVTMLTWHFIAPWSDTWPDVMRWFRRLPLT
jgi:hypothetical protein